jgi:hypothetical protein
MGAQVLLIASESILPSLFRLNHLKSLTYPVFHSLHASSSPPALNIFIYLVLFAGAVQTEFTEFFLVNNGTLCSTRDFSDHYYCQSDQICAFDDESKRTYCCDVGGPQQKCWNNVRTCNDGDGSKCDGGDCCYVR